MTDIDELDRESRARRHVESLLERVNEDGYVILPNLIPRETIDAIRRESAPLLQHDGRTEFEGMLFPFIGFVDGRDPIRLLQDRPRAGAALVRAPTSAGKEGTRT